MLKLMGRALQHVGLLALPAAIFMELTGMMGRAFGLSQMLLMMVFGFSAFYLGRYLEGFALADAASSEPNP